MNVSAQLLSQVLQSVQLPLKGSTTAVVLRLQKDELHCLCVGDSGYAILRGDKCIFLSDPFYRQDSQDKANPTPFQIGHNKQVGDHLVGNLDLLPPDAFQIHQVHEGDFVVAGSDGFFDNLLLEVPAHLQDRVKIGSGEFLRTDNIRQQQTRRKNQLTALYRQACAGRPSTTVDDLVEVLATATNRVRFQADLRRPHGKNDDLTVCGAQISFREMPRAAGMPEDRTLGRVRISRRSSDHVRTVKYAE